MISPSSERRRQVLALVHGEFSAHVVRVLAVSMALRETGRYEVLFSGQGPYMSLVERAGFPWVETRTVTREEVYAAIRAEVSPLIFNAKRTEALFQVEDALLREHRPDVVLCELFRELAGIAAKQPEVRTFDVFVQKAQLSPFYAFRFVPDSLPRLFWNLPQPVLDYLAPRVEFLLRLRNSHHLRRRVTRLGLQQHLRIDGVRPDLTLIPDAPELFALHLEPECHAIGPVLVTGQTDPPPWLPAFAADPRPKVLFSGGTTGAHEYFALLLAAFADGRYAVALHATGGAPPPDFAFGGHPFDLSSVLCHVDAFVSHGGCGSSYLGLRHRVPMLVLYEHFEQQAYAHELVARGAALSLRWTRRSPQLVRRQVDELLADPRYRQGVERLAAAIDFDGSRQRAVELIDRGFAAFAPFADTAALADAAAGGF